MRNIKLIIQYDGSNYSGWQSQKNSLAIQDVIEKALFKLTKERVRLTAAGRTDAGVHARGQVANFKSASTLSSKNIKNGLNRYLPKDVVIAKVEDVGLDFHSRYDAKSKIYRYTIYMGDPVPPFVRNMVAQIDHKLDLDIMKSEAKALLGRHDFSSFQGARSVRKSPIRHVHSATIRRRGRIIHFDIEADGFLYNMVRSIMGTLIDVSRGYLPKGSLKKILRERSRRAAGPTAAPEGLSLIKVKY